MQESGHETRVKKHKLSEELDRPKSEIGRVMAVSNQIRSLSGSSFVMCFRFITSGIVNLGWPYRVCFMIHARQEVSQTLYTTRSSIRLGSRGTSRCPYHHTARMAHPTTRMSPLVRWHRLPNWQHLCSLLKRRNGGMGPTRSVFLDALLLYCSVS